MSPQKENNLQPILVFARSLFQPEVMESFHQWLHASKEYDYQVTADITKIRERLIDHGVEPFPIEKRKFSVLFVNCLLKEDITEFYNVLSELAPQVLEGNLRVFVLNSIGHSKIALLFRARMELEMIELPVSLNALQIKIQNAFIEGAANRAAATDFPLQTWVRTSETAAPKKSEPLVPRASVAEVKKSEPFVKPLRSALVGSDESASKLGLSPVLQAGINTGEASFQKIDFRVECLRLNGTRLAQGEMLTPCEITDSTAIFFLPPRFAMQGDSLSLRFVLDLGRGETDCVLDWEYSATEFSLPDGLLASGPLKGGDFMRFFSMRDQIEKRRNELRDFLGNARE